jgi:hypothetical protein
MPMVATPLRVHGLHVGGQLVTIAMDADGRVDITGTALDATGRTLGAAPHR